MDTQSQDIKNKDLIELHKLLCGINDYNLYNQVNAIKRLEQNNYKESKNKLCCY